MAKQLSKAERDLAAVDHVRQLFEYHAAQRLRAFDFFLVFVGFLGIGYAAAIRVDSKPMQIGVAGLVAATSLIFVLLDIRNAQIVKPARDDLRDLEWEVLRIKTTRRSEYSCSALSHSVLLRSIEVLVFATAICGIVLAAVG